VLLLATGLGNINIYRPWPFDFRAGHYWAAWLTMGALVVHVAATWATSRRQLRPGPPPPDDDPEPVPVAGLSRRGFVATSLAAAAGVGIVTVGQTFQPLERLALLSPRRPSVGPQGVPVNRTAASAGVTRDQGDDPDFRLTVDGTGATAPRAFSLEELRALPQRSARLPIACVEGWSAEATWTGVPVRDLLVLVGATEDAEVTVRSFQRGNRLGSSELNRHHAHDPDTLLALELDGAPLHLDHGYPLRLIGPNRPGVLQTKWVDRLEVR
jgi:DMSO/TMAO reductase YedYZ molybdopterin-dependent catalytic subunit